MNNNKKGITLVALIITVIVLIILAGTTITIALNGNSLFTQAGVARSEWNNAVDEEHAEFNKLNNILIEGNSYIP